MLSLSPVICLADADIIFKENSKAVVVIYAYDKEDKRIAQGSGFIVRDDGAIVTNYHVISNAKDIKVKVGDKLFKVEGFLHTDKENDIVILKVESKKLPVVKIGDVDKAEIGEKVYVIGSPRGLENTISDGILSGIREITPERKMLQITAPISAGSSGGPVFNKHGEVIGIATSLIENAQNLNFAMPVNLIKDNIDRAKVIAFKDAETDDYKKTSEYWFNLGIAYVDSRMFSKSIEAYKQAIRIKPGFAVAYNNLGVNYEVLGMKKEAIEAYKQAIRIKPDFAGAHDNLGAAYANSGMYKEAIEAFKQAIRIKPDDAEFHNDLGTAYAKSGMYREAIEAYKQAIRIKPDFAEAHFNLGFTYGELGMRKEAIEAYKQSIRIKPDYAEPHNNLGTAYANSGMYKEAIEAYKQSIRIKPDYAEAHNNLGTAYVDSGMYKEAIEAFKQAIRIKPDKAGYHLNLGVSYLSLNDRGLALEQYKILKDLSSQMANILFDLIHK
jgi:tetratricopeptide (TPR) repeat protein